MLYECLAGRRPFDADSFTAIVLMAGTEPPPPMPSHVPRALQAVVLRCLEKDRRSRFASIAELAAALTPFARNQHEATTIVARANLLLRRASGSELAPADAQRWSNAQTTLSGSAHEIPTNQRRNVWRDASAIGAGVVLAAIAIGAIEHFKQEKAPSVAQPIAAVALPAVAPPTVAQPIPAVAPPAVALPAVAQRAARTFARSGSLQCTRAPRRTSTQRSCTSTSYRSMHRRPSSSAASKRACSRASSRHGGATALAHLLAPAP